MDIRISTFLCLLYMCVNCSAVSPKWYTMDVNAIEMLTRLDFLDQKLTREYPYLHDVKDVSLSSDNINKVNQRWVRDMENRIKTLENTIVQKNCDKKIQSLEEIVQELSKQVKQQALYNELYNERTEKLEAIVSDQEKTISKLRKEVIQIKKAGTMLRNFLVSPEDENDKDKKTEDEVQNKSVIAQSTNVLADPRNMVLSNKKRLLSPTIQQPVTTSTVIAFYAYMAAVTPSITIQHTLVFDIIKTNNGNGFHASTGVFIAPETGIYVFTWTVREYSTCRHSTQLMVNNAEIGIIHVDPGSGGDMSGTGVVVTQVNAGDDVYVRTPASWNDCYIGSNDAGRSSFAGWKLS